jgi:hypothetical protein
VIRRRYRTIHVAKLDRVMAEADAIGRAIKSGARRAWVESSERIVDGSGTPVWEVRLRVSSARRRRKETSREK